jgi:class 3 adenylate cyclase
MGTSRDKRRLTTILASDVVGYSKLVADDEEATVRRLHSHRQVIDKLISRHDGRIFNTGGDSVLAEFDSAVEAVRCAITIQDELRVRNAELVPDRQLQLRIGINVGDVIVDGEDLLGDGVNIAARLEGIAQPGGICISGSTFEQVKNKLSVGFEDLGPQEVKNIPDPVSAFGITSAPVSLATRTDQRSAAPPGKKVRQLSAVVSAAVAIGAVAAVTFWQLSKLDPKPFSAFPDSISTDQMPADDIAALMTGITISGRRASDNQQFEIVLNGDKTATYTLGGAGDLSGTTTSETGRWWVEDSQFCFVVPKFAKGQKACPRIVKDGGSLVAVRPANGLALPWTLSK